MIAGRTPNYTVLAALAVVATQFSNSLGAAWSKTLFSAIGPEGIVALRLGISAILLGLLTRVWRLRVERSQLTDILAYGIAMGVMNNVAYQAYARIPVGIGMAIEVTGPLALVLFHSRRGSDFVWLALNLAGLALLLFRPTGLPSVDPAGIAFAFCSAGCWAAYIVFGRRVALVGGGGRVVALGATVGACLAVPFGVSVAGAKLLEPHWLMLGFGIAVLSSAVPFFLQMMAMRRLPARVYGLLASAIPAVGALMGFAVLGETLEPRQWLGIVLVIFASAGATLGLSRSAAKG
ncbi:MAG: EamA family transporter [Alphaproteobacteria bacterium]|nr:EamA family transporter [Alphaproteobacteria bacterium]